MSIGGSGSTGTVYEGRSIMDVFEYVCDPGRMPDRFLSTAPLTFHAASVMRERDWYLQCLSAVRRVGRFV